MGQIHCEPRIAARCKVPDSVTKCRTPADTLPTCGRLGSRRLSCRHAPGSHSAALRRNQRCQHWCRPSPATAKMPFRNAAEHSWERSIIQDRRLRPGYRVVMAFCELQRHEAALQSNFPRADTSTTSGIAADEGGTSRLAGFDAGVSSDARSSRGSHPSNATQNRSAGAAASPAVDPVPYFFGSLRRGVLSLARALCFDGRRLCLRSEGIDQCPRSRPGGEIAVRNNQRVKRGQLLFQIDPATFSDRRRSGRGTSRQHASRDR